MDAQDHVQRFTQEAARSKVERRPDHSDRTWREFAESQGWALKWDGFALSEIGERENGRALLTTTESR
jgi:hypothetical protein